MVYLSPTMSTLLPDDIEAPELPDTEGTLSDHGYF